MESSVDANGQILFQADTVKINAIVDSVPNGLIIVNSSGKIIICNSEMEKMFGYGKNELLGLSVDVLVPQKFHAVHTSHRQDFSNHPSKRQMGAGRDLMGVRKDGSEIPVEIGLNPIQSNEGVFTVASVVDITERKKIDQILLKAFGEVQQRNLEMEQFVYTVSHDLKSPLVTSSSYISFLREDLKSGHYEDLNDSLERIEKANKKMHELIFDLLQLSRTARMDLIISDIDLGRLLGELQKDLAAQLMEKKAQLVIPIDLPSIKGDLKRLSQVFENLIINALKYAVSDEHAKIEIVWRETDKEFEIAVKDQGPGVPAEYHKKIFALFQRLDNSKEGTGVGLTIVSRIMTLHGGRAWIVSEPPHGAEFWIAIPKEPVASKEHVDGV